MIDVPGRLIQVKDRISEASQLAGRQENTVRLVAVTKRIELDLVLQACRAGQWDLGENRMDEALDRQTELTSLLQANNLDPENLRWHFIGHLQSRKAAAAGGHFSLLHGIDSLKLARKLAARALDENRCEPILLEVNAGREPQKNGLDPDKAVDVAAELASLEGLDLQGMMTMAARGADEPTLRKTFALLRTLNEDARTQTGLPLPQLSMGMSGDFELAIAEGATMVRVGSAIFGPRS